jgi:methionine-rich copper-binding protein CopC
MTHTARLAILLLALASRVAHAHPALDHTSPAAGSVVATPPSEVRMWFTEPLVKRFSTAEVRSSAGSAIATGGTDPADAKVIVIQLPALQAGRYTVHWKAVSTDTHRVEGDFGFEIKP